MKGWLSFNHGARTFVIKVAEMVKTKGTAFARPLSLLDEDDLQDTLRKAETALKKPGVLPEDALDKIAMCELTSLNHPSDLDPNDHSTGVLREPNGTEIGKIHVAKDSALQQPARMK